MNDVEIWMVDLDGTGSMHPASKGDHGAISYTRTDTLPTWQPIETAPRDGTHFIAYLPEFDGLDNACQVECWFSGRGLENVYETVPEFEQYYPTHWMPLPTPPATQ